MIASNGLTPNEINLLVAVRTAWDISGYMPHPGDLARLAEISPAEAREAIASLEDKGRLVKLPDGGWAPTGS